MVRVKTCAHSDLRQLTLFCEIMKIVFFFLSVHKDFINFYKSMEFKVYPHFKLIHVFFIFSINLSNHFTLKFLFIYIIMNSIGALSREKKKVCFTLEINLNFLTIFLLLQVRFSLSIHCFPSLPFIFNGY
jgi:hypothetical protein